jgi:hypothetical protein
VRVRYRHDSWQQKTKSNVPSAAALTSIPELVEAEFAASVGTFRRQRSESLQSRSDCMKCDTIDMGHGSFAFVCTRGQRHNCAFCSRYATKQCDFPVLRKGAWGTCDAWLCDRCAASQGKDVDYCPPHERNKHQLVHILEARIKGTTPKEK